MAVPSLHEGNTGYNKLNFNFKESKHAKRW
jgi:hypothetical protein